MQADRQNRLKSRPVRVAAVGRPADKPSLTLGGPLPPELELRFGRQQAGDFVPAEGLEGL